MFGSLRSQVEGQALITCELTASLTLNFVLRTSSFVIYLVWKVREITSRCCSGVSLMKFTA